MWGLRNQSDWLQGGVLGTLGCLLSWSIFPLYPCKGDWPWSCTCAAEHVHKDTKESQIRKLDIARSQGTQPKANQIIYTRPHPVIFIGYSFLYTQTIILLVTQTYTDIDFSYININSSHTVYLLVLCTTDKGLQVLQSVVMNWCCYEIAHNQFPMYLFKSYGSMVVTKKTLQLFSDTCSKLEPLCHMEGDSCQL